MGLGRSADGHATIRTAVYIEETDGTYLTITGFRVILTLTDGHLADATVRPLAMPATCWPAQPGGTIWRAAEAFVAALPGLRTQAERARDSA